MHGLSAGSFLDAFTTNPYISNFTLEAWVEASPLFSFRFQVLQDMHFSGGVSGSVFISSLFNLLSIAIRRIEID